MPRTHEKIKLTKTSVKALTPATDTARYHVYDTEVRGFCVMVTRTGKKSFYLYRNVNYKPMRTFIGLFDDMPAEMARDIAEQLRASNGDSDSGDAVDTDKTLAEVMELFITGPALKSQKERTRRYNESQFERYLAEDYGSRKISSITHSDIESIHGKIGKKYGKYSANRILSLLKSLFRFADDSGWFTGKYPTFKVKPFPEKSRVRFISDQEMPVFMKALEEDPNLDFQDYVLLSLFTGQRQNDVLSMRWDQISLESRTWFIPDPKNGEPNTIELIDEATAVLRRRRVKTSTGQDWVFPDSGSASGYRRRFHYEWSKLLKRSGIENLRMHDLRHTMATWAVKEGVPLSVVQQMLGHKQIRTTQIYAHTMPNVTREGSSAAVTAMLKAAQHPE